MAFEAYHEREMEQVKRSSFQWLKGKISEYDKKIEELEDSWNRKHLDDIAGLHTSLVLEFERQKLESSFDKLHEVTDNVDRLSQPSAHDSIAVQTEKASETIVESLILQEETSLDLQLPEQNVHDPFSDASQIAALQEEITKLQGTIDRLVSREEQLSQEIVELNKTPSKQRRVSGESMNDNVEKQVAAVKADMNCQFQNLLNEFTFQHGKEVAKLKEGTFFILYTDILAVFAKFWQFDNFYAFLSLA